MASSKSLPFAIIAGLILIVALGWKFLYQPETTPKKEVVTSQPVTKKNPTNSTSDPVKQEIQVISYDEPETSENNEPTAEDLKNIEIRSKYFMRFSMRYTTPEQAIVGLKAIRELNDDDRASALIQYIDENFPGTVIPLELLD